MHRVQYLTIRSILTNVETGHIYIISTVLYFADRVGRLRSRGVLNIGKSNNACSVKNIKGKS